MCPTGGCTGCVKARQARVESPESESTRTLTKQVLDGVIPVPSSGGQEFRIPVLVPLHKSGAGADSCALEPNAAAIADLKTALWAIDKINR